MLRLADEIQHENLLSEAILIRLDKVFEMLGMTEALENVTFHDGITGTSRAIKHCIRVKHAQEELHCITKKQYLLCLQGCITSHWNMHFIRYCRVFNNKGFLVHQSQKIASKQTWCWLPWGARGKVGGKQFVVLRGTWSCVPELPLNNKFQSLEVLIHMSYYCVSCNHLRWAIYDRQKKSLIHTTDTATRFF